MSKAQANPVIQDVARLLCHRESYAPVWHPHHQLGALPSERKLSDMMAKLRGILFPGFHGHADITLDNMEYLVAGELATLHGLLVDQIRSGLCFICCGALEKKCEECEAKARLKADTLLQRLPEIRRLLTTDVQAAFEGDPAAKTPGEIIFCYPSIVAMTHHRIAHELYRLEVPILPRMISEMAHAKTGIDIHPGASIGEEFFIDHGTGTVIGETCIIGKGCRLYQGVTLGAISFPKEADGSLVKGNARHPIVEDDVVIYAGATILGRVTIGRGSIIGGNVWLTRSVPPGSNISQAQVRSEVFDGGAGI